MLASLVPSPTIDLTTPTKNKSRPSRLPASNTAAANADATSSALTRTAISLEYASLRHAGHCPLGMYVTPSTENLLIWDAVFFVHQGRVSSQKE